jgi:hypothetical protein
LVKTRLVCPHAHPVAWTRPSVAQVQQAQEGGSTNAEQDYQDNITLQAVL